MILNWPYILGVKRKYCQNKSQSISLSQRGISIEQWSIIGECNQKNENSLSISLSQRMMSSRVHSVATKAKRQADAIKRKNTERMICNRENISVISSPIWRQDCCQLLWDWDYKGTPQARQGYLSGIAEVILKNSGKKTFKIWAVVPLL